LNPKPVNDRLRDTGADYRETKASDVPGAAAGSLRVAALLRSTDSQFVRQRRQPLDRYLRSQDGPGRSQEHAAPFVLCCRTGTIGGYYTLPRPACELTAFPAESPPAAPHQLARRAFLGRLAVDKTIKAEVRPLPARRTLVPRGPVVRIASFAVVVDDKAEAARRLLWARELTPPSESNR